MILPSRANRLEAPILSVSQKQPSPSPGVSRISTYETGRIEGCVSKCTFDKNQPADRKRLQVNTPVSGLGSVTGSRLVRAVKDFLQRNSKCVRDGEGDIERPKSALGRTTLPLVSTRSVCFFRSQHPSLARRLQSSASSGRLCRVTLPRCP